MHTVKYIGPYRLFFVSSDYTEPPHVHIRRNSKLAKFWLNPVRLAKNHGFSAVEISRIAIIIKDEAREILEAWYDFFGGA